MSEERLEAEGCCCHHLTLSTPEAAIGIKAACDVLAVKQVVYVYSHVGTRQTYTCQVVTHQRINHGVASHFEGVRRVSLAGTCEASAGTQRQTRERTIKEGVIGSCRRHVFRYLGRRVAFVVGVGSVLSLGVGIRTDHVDVG